MNFKDRGITVGDILIILILIITTTILVKTLNKDKKSTLHPISKEKILYKETSIPNNFLNNLFA